MEKNRYIEIYKEAIIDRYHCNSHNAELEKLAYTRANKKFEKKKNGKFMWLIF